MLYMSMYTQNKIYNIYLYEFIWYKYTYTVQLLCDLCFFHAKMAALKVMIKSCSLHFPYAMLNGSYLNLSESSECHSIWKEVNSYKANERIYKNFSYN